MQFQDGALRCSVPSTPWGRFRGAGVSQGNAKANHAVILPAWNISRPSTPCRVDWPWSFGNPRKSRGPTCNMTQLRPKAKAWSIWFYLGKGWCPDADSNHGHADFQSAALPTELSGPTSRITPKALIRTLRAVRCTPESGWVITRDLPLSSAYDVFFQKEITGRYGSSGSTSASFAGFAAAG